MPALVPAASEPPVAPVPKRRRRTKAELALCQEVALPAAESLSEKRRNAALTRWRQPRVTTPEVVDQVVMVPPFEVADVQVAKLPMPKEDLKELAAIVLDFDPSETAEAYKEELDTFVNMSQLVSLSAVANVVSRDERTVRRTARLIAATLVLAKKWRPLGCAKRLHHHLQRIGGDRFVALQYLVKDKYDEVALPVKQLEEIRRARGIVGAPGGASKGAKHTVTAKLVMLSFRTTTCGRSKVNMCRCAAKTLR